MKIFRILLFLFFALLLICPVRSFSQIINPADYNSWAVGVKFGVLPFYGDVRMLKYTPDNKYRKTNTGFALEGIKNFNHKIGVRADVLLAGLSGSSPNLNKHFIAAIKEFSLSGMVNLNDLISFYPEREKVINTYLFAGFGIVNFRSKVSSYDENAYMTGFGWDSTGLSKTSGRNEFTFPLGVGIKYKADPKIDIGLEYTLHLTNTDKLDAWMVDKSYMDRFGYACVSITYKLGSKKEYVDWVNPFQDTTNVFASTANQVVENDNTINTSSIKQSTINNTKTNKDTSTITNNLTKTNNQIITNNQVSSNNTQIKAVDEENYFIVSGAYKTKKLAKEAVAKLKAKGYNNAQILGESSSGSWRVSLKGYTAMEDAIAEITGIKKAYPYAKLFEKKGTKDFSEISSKIISKLLTAQADTSKPSKSVTNQTAVTNTKTNTTASNQTTVVTNANNTTTNTTANTNTNIISSTSNTNTNKTTTTENNTTQNSTNNNTTTTNNLTQNTVSANTNNSTTLTTTVIKKFFIIAASYPTEQAANDAVAELKTKGFSNAEVVGKNDYGSYRICYKGYATREEAMVDLPGIKQSTNPSAWIFEKK